MTAIPKPEPRKATKRRETARQRVERQATRLEVFQRDGYRCRCCGGPAAHVHELRFRSLGGSPYDAKNCIALCAPCHEAVQTHRIDASYGPEGANGKVTFARQE